MQALVTFTDNHPGESQWKRNPFSGSQFGQGHKCKK